MLKKKTATAATAALCSSIVIFLGASRHTLQHSKPNHLSAIRIYRIGVGSPDFGSAPLSEAKAVRICDYLKMWPAGLVDFDRRWSWDVLGGFGAASTKGSEEPFSI